MTHTPGPLEIPLDNDGSGVPDFTALTRLVLDHEDEWFDLAEYLEEIWNHGARWAKTKEHG